MINSSIIRKYSLFDGLEVEQIDSLIPLMNEVDYEAGADVIVEGMSSDKLWFIVEGRVAVVKCGIILMELGEGDVFGEMEVLDIGPVEATVKTLATSKLVSISVDAFGELYEKDIKAYSFILMNLARDLSRRLRRMNNKATANSPYMEWN